MMRHSGTASIVGCLLALLLPPQAVGQQMQMMPPAQTELIRGLLPTVVNITSFVNLPPNPTWTAPLPATVRRR
jgi:hypothetical protein